MIFDFTGRQGQSPGAAGPLAKSVVGAGRVAGRVSWWQAGAGAVSQQGQSAAGGAQKVSASAAVSKLSTAVVVVAALIAVFCV